MKKTLLFLIFLTTAHLSYAQEDDPFGLYKEKENKQKIEQQKQRETEKLAREKNKQAKAEQTKIQKEKQAQAKAEQKKAKQQAHAEKIAQIGTPFVGLNIGIGSTFTFGPTDASYRVYGKDYSFDGYNFSHKSLNGSIGLDIAGKIKPDLAIGAYLAYRSISNLSAGILFVHGDYREHDAFLWGVGYNAMLPRNSQYGTIYTLNYAPQIRLGYLLKCGLYMTLDIDPLMSLNLSSNQYHYTEDDHYNFGGPIGPPNNISTYAMALHFCIGYRFNTNK